MTMLAYDRLAAMGVASDPYRHVIVPEFVPLEALARVVADLPPLERRGSFPIGSLRLGPAAALLMEELEGPAFRRAIADKFSLDLDDAPTMLTLRGASTERDGLIHRDSTAKRVTVLLYLNPRPPPGRATKAASGCCAARTISTISRSRCRAGTARCSSSRTRPRQARPRDLHRAALRGPAQLHDDRRRRAVRASPPPPLRARQAAHARGLMAPMPPGAGSRRGSTRPRGPAPRRQRAHRTPPPRLGLVSRRKAATAYQLLDRLKRTRKGAVRPMIPRARLPARPPARPQGRKPERVRSVRRAKPRRTPGAVPHLPQLRRRHRTRGPRDRARPRQRRSKPRLPPGECPRRGQRRMRCLRAHPQCKRPPLHK